MTEGMFKKSTDTLIIENVLRSSKVGDLVTWDAMSTALGRDVRKHCRSSVASARHTLVKESIFFDVCPGEGMKRIDGETAVKTTVPSYALKARRAANKGLTVLKNVPFNELTADGKKAHLTTSAQLGAIALFGTSKSAMKIESKIVNNERTLPIGETLKLFCE